MGAADEAGVRAIAPDLEKVLRRIRMALLLTGGVVVTLALLGTGGTWLAGGGFITGATVAWVAAATVCCWLAVATAGRPVSTAFVCGAGVCTVNSLLGHMAGGGIPGWATTYIVVMLWMGLLVRPRWHFLVAVYAFVAPLVAGASYVLTRPPVPKPDVVEVPLVIVALVVPLVFNLLVTRGSRAVVSRLRRALDEVEQERRKLADDLQSKARELEASQEQLVQARKLEMVGTMAAGLAHELNNILTPIRGFAERLAGGVRDEESRRYGRRMLDSTEAAASITDALLTYTRQGMFDPVRTEVGRLLERSILPVLSKGLPSGIALRVDFERNVYVAVDRVLLQQCVANMVHNAAAAMPEGGEIKISLTTRDWEPDPAVTPDPDALAPVGGRSCVLAISDSGTGIEPEHIDRIFDPFFTTKGVGAGTGLGLAIVQGIVAMHGGYVRVDSAPGKGSTFTLVLPAVRRESSPIEAPADSDAQVAEGRVAVVVAPDQDLLDELEELVTTLGYAALCTADAARIDELLAARAPLVGLVVVDLDHPAAAAGRLCIRVRERLPQVPIVLLASPGVRSAVVDMLSEPRGVLRKPVDPALLARLATTLVGPKARKPTPSRLETVQ
jgi:signal transduction histidine kinase/CheY-like chemotaxis protein